LLSKAEERAAAKKQSELRGELTVPRRYVFLPPVNHGFPADPQTGMDSRDDTFGTRKTGERLVP
jgi:phage gp16-like protein